MAPSEAIPVFFTQSLLFIFGGFLAIHFWVNPKNWPLCYHFNFSAAR